MKLSKTELQNYLKNYLFVNQDRIIYRFKPKNLDYMTRDESLFILGRIESMKIISDLIDEFFENEDI